MFLSFRITPAVLELFLKNICSLRASAAKNQKYVEKVISWGSNYFFLLVMVYQWNCILIHNLKYQI